MVPPLRAWTRKALGFTELTMASRVSTLLAEHAPCSAHRRLHDDRVRVRRSLLDSAVTGQSDRSCRRRAHRAGPRAHSQGTAGDRRVRFFPDGAALRAAAPPASALSLAD